MKRGWGRWVTVIKTVLAAAIVVGVARQFVRILGDAAWQQTAGLPRWELLPLVGLLYLAAHTCWGSFWVRLLREQGVKVSWYAGLRCYFVSQFGKYVPGKAWVILLRVGMLRQGGAPAVAVAMTATYETLASMGAGALVAVLCLPFVGVLPAEVAGRWGWFLLVAALPVGLALLHRTLHGWLRQRGNAVSAAAPSWFLLLQGTLHGVLGWLLLGLSLGLLLEAMEPGGAWTGSRALAILGVVALAYVAGFVVLVTPGGLGVREWVLLHTLPPVLAGSDASPAVLAALAALYLRLIWTVAEVLCAALLYLRPAAPPAMIPENLPRHAPQPYASNIR
jgi:uncharacterized membrane protein YbhN (UPF0104 family)